MAQQAPKVSVAMLCRDHDRCLVEAVTSVLRQEADFPVEIVIGDDCSTDGSRQLLAKLEADHPDRIRVLYHTRSIGPNRSLAAVLEACSGTYIALLECDDYWTDHGKLQAQADFLDREPQCCMCFHPVEFVDANGITCPAPPQKPSRDFLTLEDLLTEPFIPSSSVLVRAGLVDPLPEWYLTLRVGDWPWFLLNARHGRVGFLSTSMSVHRSHAGRIWQDDDEICRLQNEVSALRRIRRHFGAEYQQLIRRRIAENYRLIGAEMTGRGFNEAADRNRRLCFLYGGWQSRLPLRTRVSHSLRRFRRIHAAAVLSFELLMKIKQTGPRVSFLVSTFVRQPTWFLRLARALQLHGLRGLQQESRILDYLYGTGRSQYARWIRQFDTLTDHDRDAIRDRIAAMPWRPTFSVVMPVYNTPPQFLRKAIDSVVRQLYPHWELCVADDGSTEPHVRSLLNELAASDRRIKVRFCAERGNISAASNAALELATGDFVVCLDHDDQLAEHALYMVAEESNRCPDVQMVYSDEDRLDGHGRRVDPYFKTDWNPDLLLSQNTVCHLSAYRRSLVEAVGGFREGLEGAQDHDLALRCSEQVSREQIRHISAVLYHWRIVPGSVSKETSSAGKARDAGARAIRDHLSRLDVQASVSTETEGGSPHYRVRYTLEDPPLVTVIIPTRDRLDLLRRCVDGLLHATDYPKLELIIVDNDSCESATHEYFTSLRQQHAVRVMEYKGTFNYSAMNNEAVRHSSGDVLCLLNNDTEVTHADWLREMVSHTVRSEIGAVGARLLYPDDSIQHAGILIGAGGLARHAFAGLPAAAPAACGRLNLIQNVSAVTAACMVLRKSVYREVGGFDEQLFPVGYNDVDMCLRIVAAGYRIVWTPYAQLYHYESVSRGVSSTTEEKHLDRRQANALRKRWAARLAADPYLNPNISIDHVDYRPAFPPRTRPPWR